MTDYIIETDFQGPGFVAVPNAVAQSADVSADALGVLVYLASMPRGWIARVAVIQERFGLGKDKWQRIARELREVGALHVEQVRTEGGRVSGRRVRVRWPELAEKTESREIRLSDRKPGKPAVGKPAKQSRKIRQTEPENPAPYKEQEKDKGAARASSGSEGKAAAARKSRGAARALAGCSAESEAETVAASLSAFQRSRLLAGQSCIVGGVLLSPDGPEGAALVAAMRADG